MLVTAAQVADTLRLLLPGFVLTKVFYQFGLRTKRTDAQWLLWGILASAPIDAFVSIWFPEPAPNPLSNIVPLAVGAVGSTVPAWIRLSVAVCIAIIAGGIGALVWHALVRRYPNLSVSFSARAWEQVLQQGRRWLQVETADKRMLIGYPKYVAHSVDTDDLDLYLANPMIVSSSGSRMSLPTVEGILISRSNITRITVFNEQQPSQRIRSLTPLLTINRPLNANVFSKSFWSSLFVLHR